MMRLTFFKRRDGNQFPPFAYTPESVSAQLTADTTSKYQEFRSKKTTLKRLSFSAA
jgi:hypothetical protein